MIQERHFSVKHDFHTATVSKSCFFLSLLLLALALIEFIFGIVFFLPASTYFALAILFFGVTGISWFFHVQFSKLSKIATELENESDEYK